MSDIGTRLRFNVGGRFFETTLATIRNGEDYTLLRRIVDQTGPFKSPEKEIFIDRNPGKFPYILDFLRKGNIHLRADPIWLADLLDEALYFGLDNLAIKVREELELIEQKNLDETLAASFKWRSAPASAICSPTYGSYCQSPWHSTIQVPVQSAPRIGPCLPISPSSRRLQSESFSSSHRGASRLLASQLPAEMPDSIVTATPIHRNRPSTTSTTTCLPAFPPPAPTVISSPVNHFEASTELELSKRELINDDPSPPKNFQLPADYDLGPQIVIDELADF